jgi:putative SOS response-associated peptidase YedK
MCNEVARRIALGELREDFSQLRIPLKFPEGAPNMAPLDSVRITDTSVIVRADPAEVTAADLVSRRWSWPGAGGRPVYNYRSDGRDLGNHGGKGGRCLIPVDSFFEFTAPEDPKEKRKTKWRFRDAAHDWFCIAGLWRADPKVGEAFTMLTTEPGPDVAPYHSRQVVVLPRGEWAAWLDGSGASKELCRPSPTGTFAVTRER